MNWLQQSAPSVNQSMLKQAQDYQLTLTKPPGALGSLESIATKMAAYQNKLKPSLENIYISVFAADHGIAAQGVSAFPQAVTTEMVKNFAAGGAAISVMAKRLDAQFEVINVGTLFEIDAHPKILDARIAAGTKDFSIESAMTEPQLQQALEHGKQAAIRANSYDSHLFIGGEMGIGNTSSASALAAAYLDIPVANLVGPGTGLASDQLPFKVQIIEKALLLHSGLNPLQQLQSLGGFEIAGLVGAYIHSAQLGIPVLVDGFISSAAAMMAVAINESVRPWLLFSHESAEPGHQVMLEVLSAEPLLSIGMRLGEGSGAAVVVSLMQSAVAMHNEMATFEDAGVSGKEV